MRSFARSVGSEHISTSAKTGQGVVELFNTLARSKDWVLMQKGIVEVQNSKKTEATKKKINTRGVLKVSGFTDFDPQMNVHLQNGRGSLRQSSGSGNKNGKNGRSGCCK